MEKDAVEALAREFIEKLAEEWGNEALTCERGTYGATVTMKRERDSATGAPTFTITVPHEHGDCTFHFNPQALAEETITRQDSNLRMARKDLSEEELVRIIRLSSLWRIMYMIEKAPVFFADFLWMLRMIASVAASEKDLDIFHPDIKRGVALSTLKVMENRLRERLGLKEDEGETKTKKVKPFFSTKGQGRKAAFYDYKALRGYQRTWRASVAQSIGERTRNITSYCS